MKRRREAKEHAGCDGKRETEREHPRIHQNECVLRERSRRHDCAKRAHAPIADADAEGSAAQRKHDALGEELSDEAPPSSAERGADGHFAFARRTARERQVRQVCAGDQQQHADSDEQHVQGALQLRSDDHIGEPLDAHAHPLFDSE